jgi:hypothetical protein
MCPKRTSTPTSLSARNRGEDFSPRPCTTREVLKLEPLPCWRHLSPEQYRAQIAALIETITTQARARRTSQRVSEKS